jgi:subtilisin family serine protease
VTPDYRGPRLLVTQNGVRAATPFALVVMAVLATDVVFAVDSVPAVYGITGDPFLVFATNAFALLNLRALHFVLQGALSKLVHLGYGLAAIRGRLAGAVAPVPARPWWLVRGLPQVYRSLADRPGRTRRSSMARATRPGRVRALLAAAACVTLTGATAVLAAPAGAAEPRSTYVVVLHDAQTRPGAVGQEMARRHRGSLGFVYEHALKGFSITVPDRAVAAIARARGVASVERDQVFRTASEIPTGVARTFAPSNPELSIDGSDDKRVDVDIAIIDTGIDSAHPDLQVFAETDCSGGSPLRGTCEDGSASDGNGHGTHVAGSAAALDNGTGVVGMATGARLHAVKVLSDSGSGYTSWIIAGIDWVTARAGSIEVANMSLGCECYSAAQDQAITNSVAAGVTYAVAAGNSDKDAATFSPANHPDVITVSALADFDGAAGGAISPVTSPPYCRVDEDDTLANFSNFGAQVEIAAPGVCIHSTWPGGGYNTISGTSMASPHVAGAAALLASTRPTGSKADTEEIEQLLVDNGNPDWTDDSGDGIPERLLDVSGSVFAPKMLSQSGTEPAPSAISLTAVGYKVKGVSHVDLSWSGATSGSVDVHRDTVLITTENDGSYTDNLSTKGGGSYTYRVCEAGTTTCSPEVTVTF